MLCVNNETESTSAVVFLGENVCCCVVTYQLVNNGDEKECLES
jgi:hypothetical protein